MKKSKGLTLHVIECLSSLICFAFLIIHFYTYLTTDAGLFPCIMLMFALMSSILLTLFIMLDHSSMLLFRFATISFAIINIVSVIYMQQGIKVGNTIVYSLLYLVGFIALALITIFTNKRVLCIFMTTLVLLVESFVSVNLCIPIQKILKPTIPLIAQVFSMLFLALTLLLTYVSINKTDED